MKNFLRILSVILLFMIILTIPVLAVSENEVQAEVDKVGKEVVTGNILVWFLCAIAFLKVSQKIDSFMSSLGINVGHTGGSMLSEALIAVRGIGMAGNAIGGNGFSFGGSKNVNSLSNTSQSNSIFSGGLSGMVSRGVTNNAIKNVNGSKSGGLGGMIYNSSVNKGGDFANNVIGKVANGNINSTGIIWGDSANKALMSYMGFTALGEGASNIPTFNDVEIGGGRIKGTEISESNPEGIQFAMYSADKYSAPESNYDTVHTADGATWYKQYAQDTIVSHPYAESDGHINRGESIEKRIPKAPPRKDRQ